MANFTDYHEGKAAMLMVEAQQRDLGPGAAANGEGSAGEPTGEPPSPVINIGSSGGGGGARFHSHLPPSSHLHNLHQAPKELREQQQHVSGDSTPTHGQAQEEPPRSPAAASSSSHVFPPVGSDAVDDIRKCGYLRKQKHGHKRFFVLRAASHSGPSRLEYYDSEKKFRSSLRASSAATVAPSSPKRVIYLYQCFTVNKRADSKNKHLIALYTKDEYFAIVAENEAEQEDWYVAVSALMNEGKKGHVDSDDLDDGYGTVTPGTVFKEVWQVNVKPKGLGQTKNLTGVYRLCLSSKTLHLVKLNSETPCVNLQLMNIRRCGHSESFFFIEVGRSSSIGPGEIWMQVDDSVVAQNMHETILETMKALKAFAEFRPRSKSQSSGSNPMPFITTRRHLGNLPPSQTGLQRRSRTESVVGTPPSSKSSGASGYRFRTSSEGEGTMNRPFRSATGSLVHLNSTRAQHSRQEVGGAVATGSTGTNTAGARFARAVPGTSTYHARSASLPVSHFPSTTSPVSVSSSSGHGSVSDTLTRPSSASICGSPSDGGFNSSDEYGSSPGDFRYFRVRSNTPDSLGNTPPIREENCLNDYMAMGWSRDVFGPSAADSLRDEGTSTEDERFSSSSLRRRTHSCSRPTGGATGGSGVAMYQKTTQTNFSLDESSDTPPFGGGLLRGGPSSSSSSLRSDYSSCSEHSQSRPSTLPRHDSTSERPSLSSSAKEDSGYVPMMCGVAASSRDTPPDYMPMLPSHSPLFSRVAPPPPQPQSFTDSHGYMMMLPGSGSGGSPSPVQASPQAREREAERPENGEYMDMSYSGGARSQAPSTPEATPKPHNPYFSLPRSYKTPTRERDERDYSEYVPMSSPAKPGHTPSHPPPPYSAHHTTAAMLDRRTRPNRLPLGRRSFHGPIRVSEPATSSTGVSTSAPSHSDDPSSPGEYINIEFGEHFPHQQQPPAYPFPDASEQRTSPAPHQDYMCLEVGPEKSQSPRPSLVAPWNPPSYIRPAAASGGRWGKGDDYTDMTFMSGDRTSPTAMLQHLCLLEGRYNPPGPATLPPISPGAAATEPKVVRADPQGRRRHSSETFSTNAPAGGASTHATATNQGAANGSYLPDGQTSRWSSSASFDSVWMSVEGLGAESHLSQPRGFDSGLSPVTSASSSSSGSSGSRISRNAGYQNGLNYIALELRDDGSTATTVTSGSDTGSSSTPTGAPPLPAAAMATGATPTGALPLPENAAYASIDFSRSDRVSSTQD
ncbi:insulin receptor substrate 2-B [Boleophthalmus pectinirostris]|uniref:insulin receptor substrate 2-B n=1 Tax=Boleophthalmus pectinirostris TaxID=150288 RepID=UPI000A1C2B70|nr:insulin receptor substrate 2-B [Boleophthalmus pectinirostris]